MKTAIVTGVCGQSGAYLARHLLQNDYKVIGWARRNASTAGLEYLGIKDHVKLVGIDICDPHHVADEIYKTQPHEIYNLAAQSHVGLSFSNAMQTCAVNYGGYLNILLAARKFVPACKIYQAGTSEMFGYSADTICDERTPFSPMSPYAISKVASHWAGVNARYEAEQFVCNGILFNHECVSSDTPLIVKKEDIIDVIHPDDLIELCSQDDSITSVLDGYDVWDGSAWVALQAITATRRSVDEKNHALQSTQARAGIVSSTVHHTMIRSDGTECRADDLLAGDHILLSSNMPEASAAPFSEDVAELLGYLAADGYIARNYHSVQFTKNDQALRDRVKFLWRAITGGSHRESQSKSGFGDTMVWQLYLSGGGTEFNKRLREFLYSKRGYKKVPTCILNATAGVQSVFLDAYYAGDGLKAGKGDSIKTNSSLLAQGLFWLYAIQGKLSSVYLEQRNGRNYYQLNIPRESSKGRHLIKPPEEIRRITSATPECSEWVFDLATESGVFMAGVGRVIVHNSPLRGNDFVTKKITNFVKTFTGVECLKLGNLDSARDWGHAEDYVEAMHLMMQASVPDDYVIATGRTTTVRNFIRMAFQVIGKDIEFEGEGVDERGYIGGVKVIEVSPEFYRPNDLKYLKGSAKKAAQLLNWKPTITIEQIAEEMVKA